MKINHSVIRLVAVTLLVFFGLPLLLQVAQAQESADYAANDGRFGFPAVPESEKATSGSTAKGFLKGFEGVAGGLKDAGIKDRSLKDWVLEIIAAFLVLLAVIALAVLIWAGVMYILSLGDETKVGKAKKMILYAVIGLIIVLISGVIVNVITNVLGA